MLQIDRTQVQKYMHKEVMFRYMEHDLHFLLSHGLFSSHSVDTGTRHLLNMIRKNIAMHQVATVLDVGCGTGILAVSIKKAFPDCEVHAVDRDALACACTTLNAEANQAPVCVHPGLDAAEYEGDTPLSYDMIVSNIPAKAGTPVLERIVANSLARLSPDGKFAFVIVLPLFYVISGIISSLDGKIVHTEHHSGHVTCIAEAGEHKPALETVFPGAYLRDQPIFTAKQNKMHYSLDTVYGLPGFDILPYAEQLSYAVFPDTAPDGTMFFWNPGQGHLPVMWLKTKHTGASSPSLVIASRDLLSLAISRHNISAHFPQSKVRLILSPDAVMSLAETKPHSLSGLFVLHDPVVGVSYRDQTEALIKYLIKPGGMFCISGKSSAITFMDKKHHGLMRRTKRKSRGYRTDTYTTI